MHAVVVRVSITDFDSSVKGLREQVVPRASSAPGFVAGYWTRADDGRNGLSMIIMDSEEAALAAGEQIQQGGAVPEGVILEGVEVREVVANA